MKKIFLLSSILCSAIFAGAQTKSCCEKPTGMGLLASNAAFAAAHADPLPLEYSNADGNMVEFQTPDAKTGSAYYLPSKSATNNVLLVFHEWWGLNDYIKRECERWQDSLGNVDVYAVDLYDGQVAGTAAEAAKISGALDPDRAAAIIKGAIAKAGRDKQIATLGWCLGGTWSFAAAVLADRQAKGCVAYYGFPEADKRKIEPIKTDVLYIRGSLDKFIDEADVKQLQKTVQATQHEFTIDAYAADHAFANPSNPHFNKPAADFAMAKALAFLRSQLGLR